MWLLAPCARDRARTRRTGARCPYRSGSRHGVLRGSSGSRRPRARSLCGDLRSALRADEPAAGRAGIFDGTREGCRAVRLRRLQLAERGEPPEEGDPRLSVFHRELPPRRELHDVCSEPDRRHRRRLDGPLAQQRGHARLPRLRRRLPRRPRARAPHDAVRSQVDDRSAQRRQHVPRPVRSADGAPLHQRSVRRLPLGRLERHQHRCRDLHVVRRPVLVRQLRELDVPAVVHVGQHALVLQRHPHADLPERQAQDRAVAHQRLAVVRQVQRDARLRRADPVAARRVGLASCRTTTSAGTRRTLRAGCASTATTASSFATGRPRTRSRLITRMAFSFTGDIGGENGDGVVPWAGAPATPGTCSTTDAVHAAVRELDGSTTASGSSEVTSRGRSGAG